MRQGRFKFVGVTVVFAVILLCVTVLAVLGVSTAMADRKTEENYELSVSRMLTCKNKGQQWLAAVDAACGTDGEVDNSLLPEGTTVSDGVISARLQEEGVTLSVSVRVAAGEKRFEFLRWTLRTDWTADTQLALW